MQATGWPPSPLPEHAETIAVLPDLDFDGAPSTVELIRSATPVAQRSVLGAMTFVCDVAGDFVLVWSERRQEWGAPGGWRERDEDVRANAVREIHEECGLVIAPETLTVQGFETFDPPVGPPPNPDGAVLQVFSTQLSERRPPLTREPGARLDPEWVTWDEFRARSNSKFWWPLAAAIFGDRPAAVG